MTVIGLTGGIASGKSTVGEQLRLLGAMLIDADRVGHRSYEPGTPGFEKVVNAFGHDVVAKDGTIDRRILGGKVFGAPTERARLEAIVWPEIRRIVQDDIRDIRRNDRNAIIVLEAAVLFEAGWQDLCDEVWVVTAAPKVAAERLMARNNLTEEQALARINAQMSARERSERADVKIDNSGDAEQLRQRVERAWKTLVKRLEDQRGGPRTTAKAPAKAAPAPARATAARPSASAKPAPARATAAARTSAPKPAATPRAAAPKAASSGSRATTSRSAAAPRPNASRAAATARPAAPRAAASRTATAAPRPKASTARTTTSARTATAARSSSARPAARPASKARPAARPAPARASSARAATPAKTAPRAAAKPAAKTAPKVAARRR